MSYTSTLQYAPSKVAKSLTDEYIERWSEKSGVDTRFINVAIAACSSNWRSSLEIFSLLTRFQLSPNVVTYNTMISTFASNGQWQRALAFAEKAREDKIRWDAVTYNAVISSLATPGKWRESLELLENARRKGLKIASQHVTGVLKAAARSKDWEVAVSLLCKFAAEDSNWASQTTHDSRSRQGRRQQTQGALIDSIAVAMAISACAFAREWKQALILFSTIQGSPVSELQLEWKKIAQRVPLSLQRLRTRLAPTSMAITSTILSLWKQHGLWGEVSVPEDDIIYAMLESRTRSRKREAEIQFDELDVFQAQTLYRDLSEDEDDDYYALDSKDDDAWRWQTGERILRWGISSGVQLDYRCFHALLLLLNEHGRWREALSVYEASQKAHATARVLLPLTLSACLKAGRWKQALDLFKSNVDIDRKNGIRNIGTDTLSLGLRSMSAGGMWEMAFDFLQRQINGLSALSTKVESIDNISAFQVPIRRNRKGEYGVSPRSFAEGIRGLVVSQWASALRMATVDVRNAGFRTTPQIYAALIDTALGRQKGELL